MLVYQRVQDFSRTCATGARTGSDVSFFSLRSRAVAVLERRCHDLSEELRSSVRSYCHHVAMDQYLYIPFLVG